MSKGNDKVKDCLGKDETRRLPRRKEKKNPLSQNPVIVKKVLI